MTRILPVAMCLAVLTPIAYGGHPLSADKLLTQSPWAQQAPATFALAQEEPPDPGPPPGAAQAGLPGNGAPGSVHWDGGVGRNDRFKTPTLNVLIRWDSAAPIIQALQQTGEKTYSPEEIQKYYILTIVGLVPGGRYRSVGRPETQSRSDDSIDSRDPEQMLEELMMASRLVPKGKGALTPQDVKLDAATGALHLFFPRTEPVTVRDKEITFYTRFGSMSVTSKFRLKDMVYQGKLEL
jgi:hypothetical protein